ncbi:hypothetical protein EVAR_41980_1 [Eumeta japonica]|uniref:Uncharacterized protein n=1 Tax=Eumeta variegata TaxID=151549 RepID=A0A4C1WPP7_EUMVA|nr:hypothetical protein EVAR_41980_1 [Eumeta japonica]
MILDGHQPGRFPRLSVSLLKLQSALQSSCDLLCQSACLLGTYKTVTRRQHLHVGLAALYEDAKAVGFRDSSHKLFRRFLARHGENYKKKCLRGSCTPAATYETRAAISKSEHRNVVHHFAHTPQEPVLRGDCEGNPKCGLTGWY